MTYCHKLLKSIQEKSDILVSAIIYALYCRNFLLLRNIYLIIKACVLLFTFIGHSCLSPTRCPKFGKNAWKLNLTPITLINDILKSAVSRVQEVNPGCLTSHTINLHRICTTIPLMMAGDHNFMQFSTTLPFCWFCVSVPTKIRHDK